MRTIQCTFLTVCLAFLSVVELWSFQSVQGQPVSETRSARGSSSGSKIDGGGDRPALSPVDASGTVLAVQADPSGQPSPCLVELRVQVPHNRKPVDIFTAFPYPVSPPRRRSPLEPLSLSYRALKGNLEQSGYANRLAGDPAYPPLGWRWEYAYKRALRRSGEDEPHLLTEVSAWCDQMIKYVRPEVKRINDLEDQRNTRYFQAFEYFNKNRTDIENEAVRLGLYPVDARLFRMRGQLKLLPGRWWITGTHKVPGLVYYWQLPIEVKPGKDQRVWLTEDNALLVTGGW